MDVRVMVDEQLVYELGQYRRGVNKNWDHNGIVLQSFIDKLSDLCEEAVRRGLLVRSDRLHKLWVLDCEENEENEGASLMPDYDIGFQSESLAMLYFFGYGSPEDACLLYVVDPCVESDSVFRDMGCFSHIDAVERLGCEKKEIH